MHVLQLRLRFALFVWFVQQSTHPSRPKKLHVVSDADSTGACASSSALQSDPRSLRHFRPLQRGGTLQRFSLASWPDGCPAWQTFTMGEKVLQTWELRHCCFHVPETQIFCFLAGFNRVAGIAAGTRQLDRWPESHIIAESLR